jgi:nucleoside-diphosphate-sugar epimerase
MRIFLAGATGAVGRLLVPMLVADGHAVVGTTRHADRAAALERAGATAAVVDAYDPVALARAVASAAPDAVIDQLTDLAANLGQESYRRNARLRTIATRNLVDAMLAADVSRLVAQSAAWLYATGPVPHTEVDPLRDPATDPENVVLPGVLELERLVLGTKGIEGTVLRYGFLYGPGTDSATRGDRPSVQVAAAARAAALAVAGPDAGIFNIVDDGEDVSNRRARQVLGWDPGRWA